MYKHNFNKTCAAFNVGTEIEFLNHPGAGISCYVVLIRETDNFS